MMMWIILAFQTPNWSRRRLTLLADLYKNKSVAEQNYVDLAWELLMEPAYRIY